MEITRATIELRVDQPGRKKIREKITIELDAELTQALLGGYMGCTDKLRVLVEKLGGDAIKSDHIGWIGRLSDWTQRAIKAFRD